MATNMTIIRTKAFVFGSCPFGYSFFPSSPVSNKSVQFSSLLIIYIFNNKINNLIK